MAKTIYPIEVIVVPTSRDCHSSKYAWKVPFCGQPNDKQHTYMPIYMYMCTSPMQSQLFISWLILFLLLLLLLIRKFTVRKISIIPQMQHLCQVRGSKHHSHYDWMSTGKVATWMYRCPLLVPLPGCHLVPVICYFSAVWLLSRFLFSWHSAGNRQVITCWLDVHWILWSVQKLREVFHLSLSLSFFSDNQDPISVFGGSLRLVKYSREFFLCWHKQVCFLCLDSLAIQVRSLVCSDVLLYHFVGLCVCCLCSDFLRAGATVVEHSLSILPFICLSKSLHWYPIFVKCTSLGPILDGIKM